MQPQQLAGSGFSQGKVLPKPRTGLVTLLFTDMVDSTALKQQLGDQGGAALFRRHHELVRELLRRFPEGQEIETAGDSFLMVFGTPSEAVRFGLLLETKLRQVRQETSVNLSDRIGIHVGEVLVHGETSHVRPRELYGIQIDTCARIMSLAKAGQVLMSRGVFDSARQVLKGEDIEGIGALEWLNHGAYLLKGLDEPVEICEVREAGRAQAPGPPTASEKAQRQVRPDEEAVLGWRPAVGQPVPNTRWRLEKKLGEGGFGEVWLGRNSSTKQARVFKFCFQAERVRFLKRELTLFRLLKERMGDHPNIVAIQDVSLEQPPFYVEMEYVEGKDLRSWCEGHGGIHAVQLQTRLEIVAQAAEGLQAAHDAGIIHRDVKPANILVGGRGISAAEVRVKITDFGIGQVVSEEFLQGITRAGFTETLAGSTSSHTGTQLYMAPELLAGKPASPRSDVYSLGVVLYQVLVGDWTRPVATDWAADVDDPLLREDLRHCFAGKPEDRFTGAGQLARHLRQLPGRRLEVERRQAELAERERAAYRRGILRTAGLATVIVLVMGALALVAFSQSRKARHAAVRATAGEQRARQNLYAADMLLAAQALQANNRGRAVQLLERYQPGQGVDLRGWEWRHLWSLCQTEAIALEPAHGDRMSDIVFSPDGALLYTGSHDATIKVWDIATRTLRLVKPQPFAVYAMALSPDGRSLVAGSLNGDLLRWDTQAWTSETLMAPTNTVVDLLFSPAGEILAIRRASELQLLRLTSGEILGTLPTAVHSRNGQSMAFSPDGRLLAYPAPQGKVGLLDLAADWGTRTLPGSMDSINSLAFSPDCRILAAADWSPRIAIWDVAANRELRSLTNHAAWVAAVAFHPNRPELISASADQTLRAWNINTWEELSTRRGHSDELHCLAVSPRGEWIATGAKDGALNLWSTSPPPKPATRLEFAWRRGFLSREGGTLLVLGTNRMVRLWDAVALKPKGTPQSFPYALPEVQALLEVGLKTLAVGLPEGDVELWSSAPFKRVTGWKLTDDISSLRLSQDDQRLAVIHAGREISIVQAADGQPVAQLALPSEIWGVEFSPDGDRLVVALSNGSMQLWKLAPLALLKTLTGQREPLSSEGMAFSPDGRFLATGSPDASLRQWNLDDGSVASLPRALMAYFAVAYSPDGQRIAAVGPDPVVRIIDATTAQETAALNRNTGYRDFAQNVTFTRDGDALLVLTATSLTVWRTASAREPAPQTEESE